ncbi:MAG: hypothetical protein WD801_12680 [Gemmatimonadaceae bacterium]
MNGLKARNVRSVLAFGILMSCGAPPRDFDAMYRYDAALPIASREVARDERPGATVVDLTFRSALGGDVPAYLVLPQGTGPFPVVLFGHWMMPGSPMRNRHEFLEEAVVLARAGAASLLIDAPQVRPGFPRDSNELATMALDAMASRQQVVDFRRGLDLLISRGDVDPDRIAFVGHSFNAHVGGILAAVEKRIGSFVLMAGGFADEAYVFDSTNAQMVAFRSRHGDAPLRAYFEEHRWDDPVNFVGRSAPATVFLQFGSRDDAIPSRLGRHYYGFFAEPKEIAFYDAGHSLDAIARRARVTWLAQRLALAPLDTSALDRIAALQ